MITDDAASLLDLARSSWTVAWMSAILVPASRGDQLDSRGGRGAISRMMKLLSAMDGRPVEVRLRFCAAIATSTRLRTFSFCIRIVM
jgi:hypothetical protein